MKSQNVRDSFLNYFHKHGLPIVPSSSLIPHGDPTLLFTSAGMVQFKPYYLGLKKDLKNAVTSQKCLRTTDIDNVGFTKRHLTFFEMLGNFSFGDYFKKQAITWAWDYLTNVLKIDKERLYVSIYKGGIAQRDEEAYNIWAQFVDKERIYEFDEKDNFWTMGPTGPCGPCSEIYYDFGEENACPECSKNGIACNCGRFVEIWNLVFTQFDRQEDGSIIPLPHANIDTGMGLERLCMVMQNVDNPFDTDLFTPIIGHAKKILNIEGKTKLEVSTLRIIADHIRSSCFLISEGILPANDGRGYILRRLIRRAVRYGKLAGRETAFMHELVPTVLGIYKDIYPELLSTALHISNTIKAEETAFLKTLTEGEARLQDLIKNNPAKITGKEAFYLYETYGFPLELTKEILAENNLNLDEKEFFEAKEKAKEISRVDIDEFEKEKVLILQTLESKFNETKFVGYDTLSAKAKILALLDSKYQPVNELQHEGYVITDITPFYAECGGQVGDTGTVESHTGSATVKDTQKPLEKLYLHKVAVGKGSLKEGDEITLKVDEVARFKTASNHTAVHVLNAALRKILGEEVHQAGSFVSPEKLRFDYTISATPTPQQLLAVWGVANDIIARNLKVEAQTRPLADAKTLGATVLLGETYADPARFLIIGKEGFVCPSDRASLELCGGTHIKSTGEIMVIRIIKESAVSAGVRRIEAVAGLSGIELLKDNANAALISSKILNTSTQELVSKVESLIKSEHDLKKEVAQLRHRLLSGADSGMQENIKLKDGAELAAFNAENTEIKELRNLADNMADKNKGKVILISTDGNGKKSFVVKSFAGGPAANELAKNIAALINGKGGGKPDFAQGGGEALPWQDFAAKLKTL